MPLFGGRSSWAITPAANTPMAVATALLGSFLFILAIYFQRFLFPVTIPLLVMSNVKAGE
jgi:hypothetical protein